MDESTKKNQQIWDKLAQNGILCSRPKFDLNPEKARAYIQNSQHYGEDLEGKHVLCLASGGGQQSIAFALLGASVTVVDFSMEQLKRDELIATHMGKNIRIIQSDMRELDMLENNEFDIVYQPYSINYIPSIEKLFNQLKRILKPNGIYDLMFHNPFVHGTWKDGCWGSQWNQDEMWNGIGYPLWQPYADGHPIQTLDPTWNFSNLKDQEVKLESPQEYKHTLSRILNGLISRQFEIVHIKEETHSQEGTTPGTWEHYQSCAPPWIYVVSRKK